MPVVATSGVAVAWVAAALGRPEAAARSLGAAAQLRGSDDVGDQLVARLVTRLRGELGDRFDDCYRTCRQGRDREIDDLLSDGMAGSRTARPADGITPPGRRAQAAYGSDDRRRPCRRGSSLAIKVLKTGECAARRTSASATRAVRRRHAGRRSLPRGQGPGSTRSGIDRPVLRCGRRGPAAGSDDVGDQLVAARAGAARRELGDRRGPTTGAGTARASGTNTTSRIAIQTSVHIRPGHRAADHQPADRLPRPAAGGAKGTNNHQDAIQTSVHISRSALAADHAGEGQWSPAARSDALDRASAWSGRHESW